MDEYKHLCVERARELARKPYPLTARQIAERTGISQHYAATIINEEKRHAAQG